MLTRNLVVARVSAPEESQPAVLDVMPVEIELGALQPLSPVHVRVREDTVSFPRTAPRLIRIGQIVRERTKRRHDVKSQENDDDVLQSRAAFHDTPRGGRRNDDQERIYGQNVTDADVQAEGQADCEIERRRHHYKKDLAASVAVEPPPRDRSKKQQSKESECGFDDKCRGEIEPAAVRIELSKEERGAGAGRDDQNIRQAGQVRLWPHMPAFRGPNRARLNQA